MFQRIGIIAVIVFVYFLALVSCGQDSQLSSGVLGFGKARILVVNANTAATPNYTITLYDENGNLLKVIADYSAIGGQPRGIAVLDPFNYVVALENFDRLDLVPLFGNTQLYAADTQYTGTINDVIKLPDGGIMAIEGNTLERFVTTENKTGERFTAGATPFISTPLTTGANTCTSSVPRGMAINSQGYLVVTNTTNDRLNIYDISAASATCVAANTTPGAVDPLAIVAHTDGNIYVANSLAANSQILRYAGTGIGAGTVIWPTNLPVLSTPTAMAELPNGNLIVASSATDSLVIIGTDGTLIDPIFISNSFTTDVVDIEVLPAQ